jgi:uncharacterized protein
MSATNKSVLEQANAEVAKGNNEGFLAHCTEDIRWTTVGESTLEGKQAVRTWMKHAYATPPKFNVERIVAEGDVVIALGTIEGEGKDGNRTIFAYSDVWHLRDGKLASLDAFVVAI